MLLTNSDKKEQALFIDAFKMKFINRFGIIPEITITDTLVGPVDCDLTRLERIVNDFIPADIRIKYPRCISRCRKRDLGTLKMIFMMLARDMDHSLNAIGEYVGGRDHSTVIHGINTGYDLLETDKDFQNLYINVSQLVNPQIYPHARITELTQQVQADGQPASANPLHVRKYKVFRPGSGYQRRDTAGKTKRINRQPERAVA